MSENVMVYMKKVNPYPYHIVQILKKYIPNVNFSPK